jgi:ubiquitin-protein ligase
MLMIHILVVAVKRILQEAKELANDPSSDYSAAPLEVRTSREWSALITSNLLYIQDDIFVSRRIAL